MLYQLGRTRSDITERREAAHQQDRKLAEAGFTLIELLIVIVILGILAAVVVFSVQGIQDKGQDAACASDAASVNTAVQAYYAQNGSYPTDLSALTASGKSLLTNIKLDTTNKIVQGGGYTIAYATTGSGYTLTPSGGTGVTLDKCTTITVS